MMNAVKVIQQYKLVPVVVFNNLNEVVPVLSALQKGGLPIAEITFRTACAPEAIRLAVKEFPDMLIGAGTIINAGQCETAFDMGAKYIVSPGSCEEVALMCKKRGFPYIPGVVTPTDIIKALSYDEYHFFKFFPAGDFGGLKTVKALSAAFPNVTFMPTGGVGPENLLEYLSCPCVGACGGTWMVKGSPAEIEAATKKAMDLIGTLRR